MQTKPSLFQLNILLLSFTILKTNNNFNNCRFNNGNTE